MAGWNLFVGAGSGLILAGRYYIRLNPETLDREQQASSFGRFSVVHRRQLKVLAQTGAVLSLIHFGAACIGRDWPGRWFLWPLGVGSFALLSIARKMADPKAGENLGWHRVPKWVRAIVEPTGKAGDAAMFGLLVLVCWNQWSGQSLERNEVYRFGSRMIVIGYLVILYVLEALFFTYGDVRQGGEAR
jgi:hypothetical protein